MVVAVLVLVDVLVLVLVLADIDVDGQPHSPPQADTCSIESAATATDWSKTILRGYVELPIARGSAMRGGGWGHEYEHEHEHVNAYDHVNAYVYEHVNGDVRGRDGKGTGGTSEDVPPVGASGGPQLGASRTS